MLATPDTMNSEISTNTQRASPASTRAPNTTAEIAEPKSSPE